MLALVALVWTFVLEPRRVAADRGHGARAAAPSRHAEPHAPPARVPADAVREPPVVELLRSLERMEADLAEMRAEVERMRRHLCADRTVPVERPPR